MGKTFRDGRGGRINGEILGYSEYTVGENGKIYSECGGSAVGSKARKRDAKQAVVRMRRLKHKRDLVIEMNEI